jgi:Uma2 family endonuclease
MAISERLYTADEFLAIASLPENSLRRLELIEGEIVEMPPSSQENTVVAARFVRYLGEFVDEHDLGHVTGAGGGFIISANTVLMPDAAFISKDRHPELSGVAFPLAPDLAVEVISPSETSNDVLEKVKKYIDAGTHIVWTAFPLDRVVYVWTPSDDDSLNMRLVRLDGTLDGGGVLPGFTLPLRKIFPR